MNCRQYMTSRKRHIKKRWQRDSIDNLEKQKYLKQNEIIKTSGARISFLIKSVYDLLPTPANRNKWFKTEDKCKLCGEEGTLNHILAGCKVALHQGRYKWRHDKVLKKDSRKYRKENCVENTKVNGLCAHF